MNSKIEDEERAHFSERLTAALRAAGCSTSPSAFANEFNLRADGATVTVHGARKWLLGEAIPTHARVKIIADWLSVSAAWLQYGDDQQAAQPPTGQLDSADLMLVKDLHRLSISSRTLVRGIVDLLLRQERA
ncbi:MAG: hypothetical protein ACJ8GW_01670 [Massilia sp.]